MLINHNQIDIFSLVTEQQPAPPPATPKKIVKEKKIVETMAINYIEENKKILYKYRLSCRSKGLTKESIKAICDNDLRVFINYIGNRPLSSLNHLDVQEFLLYCEEERGNEDEAIARKYTSINCFYNSLIKQDILTCKNPCDKLEKPKVRKKQRGYLTQDEYEQILKYIDNSNAQSKIRDAAIISFFYASGCRLTEVYQQDRDNLDYVNCRFKVLGKGEKERTCIFNKEAADRIQKYLDTRTDDLEALFISREKHRLSKKSIQDLVKRIAKRAGIKKNVHPHIFRHTRAMHLLQKGAKLETIQRLLGHASISTTQIYAHMNMDEVQDEVAQIDGDL